MSIDITNLFKQKYENNLTIKKDTRIEENLKNLNILFGDGTSKESPEDVNRVKLITFTQCRFDKQIIKSITFTNCKFIECSFIAIQFNDIEFHNSTFENCLFIKPKFNNTYLDPSSIKFDFNKWKKEASNINTTLFQRLETNLLLSNQEKLSRTAYINFRKYKRWQVLYSAKNKNFISKLSAKWNFCIDILYKLTMGYGFGLSNIIVTTALLGTALSIFVDNYGSLLGIYCPKEIDASPFIVKMYFIVVTATTLGYGDISPKKEYGLFFVMVILLFSIIWTATITAILVKKIVK